MNNLLQKSFRMTQDSSLWSRLEPPTLGPDEIHVWRINLNVSQSYLDYLFCLLSNEEKNKAQRFRVAKTRDAFIARRGLLRILLSRYLTCEAPDLRFTHNAFDKPLLESPSESYELHFNLSHADDVAVIALSRNDVGIDIERVDATYPCLTIAEEFFADHEIFVLHALPRSEVVRTFFRYWTAKEAVAKAIGIGLSISLSEIGLEFLEGKPGGHANVLFPTCDVWHFYHLEFGPHFIVAVASRKPVQHVIYSDILEF